MYNGSISKDVIYHMWRNFMTNYKEILKPNGLTESCGYES